METARVEPGWRIAGAALAWLGGVALQLQQPALWPPSEYLGLAAAMVGLLAEIGRAHV
jgi:hypothetical protein